MINQYQNNNYSRHKVLLIGFYIEEIFYHPI